MSNFEIRTVTGERHNIEAHTFDSDDLFVTLIDAEGNMVATIPTRQLSLVTRTPEPPGVIVAGALEVKVTDYIASQVAAKEHTRRLGISNPA